MKSRPLITVTAAVLIVAFIPFEVFFVQDIEIIKQDNRYKILVKDEKVSEIPAPYLQDYYGQTDLILPMFVTQHIQSDFPISSVNLRDIHFLNNI